MKVRVIFFLLWGLISVANAQMLDRIVAIVGDEVILDSDVDNQYNYRIIQGEKDQGTMRCGILENLIISKLLLDKAVQDSIEVSDNEVAREVSSRTEYILSQMGGNKEESEKQFVKIYGKSLAQFKVDVAEDIKKELLIDRQRGAIVADVDVTPREVKAFYKGIPVDSLGLLPAEVQLYHIVIKPPWSETSIAQIKTDLTEYRRQIMAGEATIDNLAMKFSDEPAARKTKGSLGEFGRGQMVSEFEEMVYQMRVGEVSRPFRTEYGFHIVQLNDRRGEIVAATHILKIPKFDAKGDQIAKDSLAHIRSLIVTDSLTFEEAAIRFSEDRSTRDCGGCIVNPQTQDLRIPLDALDAELYFQVETMKPGEISEPIELVQPDGSRVFHIVYLKSKIPPHKPNLKDDYQKIRNAALQNKQAETFETWLDQAQKNVYVEIKPSECANALKNWIK